MCIVKIFFIQHKTYGLFLLKGNLTALYEDNVACIAQIKGGYIKGEGTKHISPEFFFMHELQKKSNIDVHQIWSSDNLADLLIKSTFYVYFWEIGTQDWATSTQAYMLKWGAVNWTTLFFPCLGFVTMDFPNKIFNKVIPYHVIVGARF